MLLPKCSRVIKKKCMTQEHFRRRRYDSGAFQNLPSHKFRERERKGERKKGREKEREIKERERGGGRKIGRGREKERER